MSAMRNDDDVSEKLISTGKFLRTKNIPNQLNCLLIDSFVYRNSLSGREKGQC